LYLRTLNIRMMPQSQLIFDKLVYDFCPFQEMLFCHKQKEKSCLFFNLLPKFVAQKKYNIVWL
jgi:hypothetical protein